MSDTIHYQWGKDVTWTKILTNSINLGSMYQVMPTEGYLAWEYNPLRNYRLSQNMYEKDGKYYTEEEFFIITGETSTSTNLPNGWTLHESGELVDFITDELSFNLNHPVEILPQYSYDGSVNLILNDGLNIPRLINSRFTVTGKNTYKIIDRKGDNDTNIYDQGEQFDVDTSLFKNVNKIPQLEYLGTGNGNMKIGNYHFYFKYADADGNESDWVAESGLVSIFIGTSPLSVDTGIRDENSIKSVRFTLSNIDIGYSFVKIYYTRYSAEIDGNYVVEAKRIDKNFLINNSGICNILITGDENETEVTLEEINESFDVIQNAKTQCSASNRLFMANIHKSKIEYDILSKLSLCFCPYKATENYPLTDSSDFTELYEINSNSDGYYDSKYIYDKTGYWPNELYRLGVVYILKDGSISPVFNIRGATNISNAVKYKIDKDFKDKPLSDILASIDYSDESYLITGGIAENENAKGVIQLSTSGDDNPFKIYGINIKANHAVIQELKKYCKGFFFVRQKRMPLTLCQGLVVGLDKESRTPTLPTMNGILQELNLENSFVETSDIKSINYVSEGFLSRFRYDLKDKEQEGMPNWLKGFLVGVVVGAAVLACVFTCGMAAPLLTGAAISIAAGSAAAFSGAAIGTALAIGTVAGLIPGLIAEGRQKRQQAEPFPLEGRKQPVPEGQERKERDGSRKLNQDIAERYIITDPSKNTPEAIIVPDYQVNQPYYNQFFTGGDFTVKLSHEQPETSFSTDGYLNAKDRHFYANNYILESNITTSLVKLVGVPDGCPIKVIEESQYRARAGYPEEAYKYEFQGNAYEDSINQEQNSDIIRGNFGSYVGMSNYAGHAVDQINIMIPGYKENDLLQYIQLRAQDTSAFYAISDRIDINNINKNTNLLTQATSDNQDFSEVYYRGDCYICQFTHRINRNFNDLAAPYNDKIVDSRTWKENYHPDTIEDFAKINAGDVNAVKLGLWVTFKLRSSYNLNIRTIDKSNVDEVLMCGNYRSFYPHYNQLADGNYKIPDSDQYNKGFSKSVSEKYYFEIPDVPYIKQEFQNRIVFSDIHINDAYKNGFRVLRTMNHKDYPMTYGSITKILEGNNSIIVIFEHGIGMIKINNSAQQAFQVLSDLIVINDSYGSQWKDSIIKTPNGIYGIDTVAKKIWRITNNLSIELISDLKVQEFLNQNITLSERELTPIIGVRNVKTVYNAFKHDVMFTFYDNLYGIHEKSWNLCYNEMLGIFTTFYSWIPSEMQNIDNIPFSFDRTTVKAITKLGISNHDNDFSDGVTLTNNVLNILPNKDLVTNKELHLTYLNPQGEVQEYEFKNLSDITSKSNFIGFLHLDGRLFFDKKTDYSVEYELLRDNQGNHNLFKIQSGNLTLVQEVYELNKKQSAKEVKVYYLVLEGDKQQLRSELYYRNKKGHSYADIDQNKIIPDGTLELPIFKNKQGKRLMLSKDEQINPDKLVRYLNIKAKVLIANQSTQSAQEAYYDQFTNGGMIDAGYFESQVAVTTDYNLAQLFTDFWKHGQAGLIDIVDKVYPTYWYGQQHPFEFECMVVNNPSVHKIFTNLELVANKVKPESFHYEIIGDVYDFAEDKPTMYFRQEALKALYQYNGYDIEYNSNFLEIEPKQHNKSADLPKYYSRWDTINEIYDSYKRFSAPEGFNYDHLAGAEVIYYPTRNEFRIWNHTEAVDQDATTSVIKANCRYLEDKWLVSINPIIVTYKNEFTNKYLENEESIFAKDDVGVYTYSSWVNHADSSAKLPPINIKGTKLQEVKNNGEIEFPKGKNGKDNALYGLYDLESWDKGDWSPIDPTGFSDRQEVDVRGKFLKIRIRYSGEELAIIDFLNTIYQISFV